MEHRMQYITISDLKNQAKKLRKNNSSIKNHADSLDIIAKKYNYDSWTELLNSSLIKIENSNENSYSSKGESVSLTTSQGTSLFDNNGISKFEKNLFSECVEQLYFEIKYFNSLLEHDENNELYDYFIRRFLPKNNNPYDEWHERAKILAKVICTVFRKSNCKKDFSSFRELIVLDNLISTIFEENLIEIYNVEVLFTKCLPFETTNNYEITGDIRQQYGFLAMQYTKYLNYENSIQEVFEKTLLIRENVALKIKEKNMYILKYAKDYLSQNSDIFNKYDSYIKSTGEEYEQKTNALIENYLKERLTAQ
jgi:hypothetical protein